MESKFHELQKKIGLAIEHKTIEFNQTSQHRRYAERYDDGDFRPSFDIVERDGGVQCIWCQNKRKDDGKILRLNFKQASEGLTHDEWESFSLQIKHAMEDTGGY